MGKTLPLTQQWQKAYHHYTKMAHSLPSSTNGIKSYTPAYSKMATILPPILNDQNFTPFIQKNNST